MPSRGAGTGPQECTSHGTRQDQGGGAAVAIVAAIVAILSVPADSRAETPAAAPPDRDAVREIGREYLLKHPEVTEATIPVPQARREARKQDRVRAALREHDGALRSPPDVAGLGQPAG